jgi:TolB protein
MARGLALLTAAALVTGAPAAGCGDDDGPLADEGSHTVATAPPPRPATTTSAPEDTTPAPPAAGTSTVAAGPPAASVPLRRAARGIAFVRYSSQAGRPRVHVVAARGGPVTELPTATAAAEGPAWSPDGRRIAFVGGANAPESPNVTTDADLFVARADGSGRRRLTRGAEAEAAPAWSPDGRRLVAVRRTANGRSSLVVLPAAGGPARRITRGAVDVSPSWGRDGRIAFVRIDPRTNAGGLYVVRADGGGLRRILRGLPGATGPVWSPDGSRLAVALGDRLVVVRPDGTGRRDVVRLTSDPGGARREPQPAWSPDGRHLAFSAADPRRSGRAELWTVPARGGPPRRLLRSVQLDTDPSWGP